MEIKATKDDLHTLQRALSGLRDLVKSGSMSIDLTVDATSGDGPIDPIGFQQRVGEPLDEDPDVTHRVDWS